MDMIRKAWAAFCGAFTTWVPTVSGAGLRSWSVGALDYMRRSFVALVSSKSAWAAVIVIGLSAYVVGHMAGSRESRQSHGRVAPLMSTDGLFHSAALEDANARSKAAAASAQGWKDEAKKKQDEVAQLAAELNMARDALAKAQADLKRLRHPTAKKADTTKAPTPAPWNPFE